MNWTLLDFSVAGALLGVTGILIALAAKKIHTLKYRMVAIGTILTVCALIWAELAVGIFGTPFAGS